MDEVRAKSVNAKNASKKLRMVDVKISNAALFSMADALIANKEIILKENEKDIPADHLGLFVKPIENVKEALAILFGKAYNKGEDFNAG